MNYTNDDVKDVILILNIILSNVWRKSSIFVKS